MTSQAGWPIPEGEKVPRRKGSIVTCPTCGRHLVRKQGAECLSCLRLFHSNCLVRVKRRSGNGRRGRLSYQVCRECFEEKPGDRVLTGNPDSEIGSVEVHSR